MRNRIYEFFLLTALILGTAMPVFFWCMAKPGYSCLVADMPFFDLLPAAILTALALGTKNRFLAGLSVVVTFFLLLVKVGIIVLYHESFLPLTFDSIAMLWEHTDHRSVQEMIGHYYYIWFPICMLAVLCLMVVCIRGSVLFLKNAADSRRNRVLCLVMVCLLISLTANARYVWYKEVNTAREENYVGQIILPLHLCFAEIVRDAVHAMRPDLNSDRYGFMPKAFSPDAEAWLKKSGLIRRKSLSDPPTLPYFDRIIVIAAESLDADFISSVNPEMPKNLTPCIDRLKKKYLSFSNYFSAAQPTSWGMTALMLSRPDYKLDKMMKSVSLTDLCRERGIRSWYFSPVVGEFGDNRKIFHKLLRFDDVFFEDEIRRIYPDFAKSNGEWGLSDESVFRSALAFLQTQKPERFFIVISTMDTHHPYYASGPAADDPQFRNDRFFRSVHCVDGNIGHFVDAITADPALFNDRTLIIVTADHSACHGRHAARRKILLEPSRIPLIFVTKNPIPDMDPEKLFSTLDLSATLARMLSGSIPDTFIGDDFMLKKPSALARDMEESIHLFLPDGSDVHFSKTHPNLKTPQEKALFEFYSQYYLLQ